MNKKGMDDLQKAYAGCGRPRPRQKELSPADRVPSDEQLHKTDNFILLPEATVSFPFLDQYVSPKVFDGESEKRAKPFPEGFDGCVTESDPSLRNQICTGFYGNYQGGCFALDVAAITVSSTYVSSVGSSKRINPSGVNRGVAVRAYVRRDAGPRSFVPYDRMGYADNNVPTAQGAIATWVFGNAHPKASEINRHQKPDAEGGDREQNMWGWTVIRRPVVNQARYTC